MGWTKTRCAAILLASACALWTAPDHGARWLRAQLFGPAAPGPVPFDDEDPSIIGKRVMVGVRFVDANGTTLGLRQSWGRILAYNAHDGLRVDLRDQGQVGTFPPVPDAMHPANLGTYELMSTAEKVEDPDFTYVFVMSREPAGAR